MITSSANRDSFHAFNPNSNLNANPTYINEVSSAEELIWTYLGEIFLVIQKSSKSGILLVSVDQYVGSYVVR